MVFRFLGIIYYCVVNMLGIVFRIVIIVLNNVILKFGLEIVNKGLEKLVEEDFLIKEGLNIYKGYII